MSTWTSGLRQPTPPISVTSLSMPVSLAAALLAWIFVQIVSESVSAQTKN